MKEGWNRNQNGRDKGLTRSWDQGREGNDRIWKLVNKARSVLNELHEEVKLHRVGVGQKERFEGKVGNS